MYVLMSIPGQDVKVSPVYQTEVVSLLCGYQKCRLLLQSIDKRNTTDNANRIPAQQSVTKLRYKKWSPEKTLMERKLWNDSSVNVHSDIVGWKWEVHLFPWFVPKKNLTAYLLNIC
jgi:hypothetical protein